VPPPPGTHSWRSTREALEVRSARVPFKLKLAVVWVVIFGLLAGLFAAAGFDTAWMRDNAGFIARGITYTIIIATLSIALASVLALLGALGRLSHNAIAVGVTSFYTSFFRGTPLIVQLFLIYLALPQIGLALGDFWADLLTLDVLTAGVIALGLNYGAYMTEIFRGGIQSVGHGQAEAAEALGMTYWQKMRRVILPQALRVIIPPTGNEFIAMMKDTALVGVIGGVQLSSAELFKRASISGNQDLKKLESLLIAAGLYWALTAVFTFFQRRLERRISKGYVRGDQGKEARGKEARRPRLLRWGGRSEPVALIPAVEAPGGSVGHGRGGTAP
jgi:polar amino acid transport system permease protein